MGSVIAEYQRRRDLVYEALTATPGVTVRRPEGAFYLCPRLPVDDANRFAEFLLVLFARLLNDRNTAAAIAMVDPDLTGTERAPRREVLARRDVAAVG